MSGGTSAGDALRARVEQALAAQYMVEGELGRGGMAAVYRALDQRLRRRVAIKVLPPELAFDPAVRERFMREAQLAAQLSHPNIVPIHLVDERDGITYFVMALVEGESVGAVLERGEQMPIERVRRILVDVADALAYAHARGVVHRDIKPDNILLDAESGRPMVTDFGIARAVSDGATRLTATGMAVGTPAYMSPEQAVGDRDIDARTDIYSLGVVGYHLLTGRPPFSASTTMGLLMKQVSESPPRLEEVRGGIPREIQVAVERALRKAPEERWQTAGEMREALIGAVTIQGPPTRTGARRPEASVPAERDAADRSRRRDRRGSRHRLDKFASLPLEERLKKFRMTAIRNFGTVGGLATINLLTSPDFLWFLIPGAFMMIEIASMFGSLWSDGVGARQIFRRGGSALPSASAGMAPAAGHSPAGGLLPVEMLTGPLGAWVHRAATDHAAIKGLLGKLSATDRERIPEVEATAQSLLDRVVSLTGILHGLHGEVDGGALEKLDARIAELKEAKASTAAERRLELLERQRATVDELIMRRAALMAQLESAVLALENMKFDLVKLRSAGFEAGLADVRHATQEARALSAEIGRILEAVEEVRAV